MKKFFSIDLTAIIQKTILSAKRFSVSVLLIAGFACLLFVKINAWEKNILYQLYIFFSLGSIISVAATLYLENLVGDLKRHIITVFITLLWTIYCLFLPSDDEFVGADKIIEISVIGSTAFLSIFFISFLKKDSDDAFWNFTTQTIFQLGLAVCFGGIIFVGLYMTIWSVTLLFGINYFFAKLYGNLAIFCFVLFSPLYFLANIPDKISKYDKKIALNKTSKILNLYILTPLATIYAAILYVYLLKIIIAWQLPNGNVSYLVSSLMFVGLFIIISIYPARFSLQRYFGLLMLPLLLLMSIGITRRFDDYGITIARCYILLLNLWFYGICVYIFMTKARRIKWIFISFAAIVLLVSIGPWSVSNVTKHILIAQVKKYENFDKIDVKDKEKIENKKKYLREKYGKTGVSDIDVKESEIKYVETNFSVYNSALYNKVQNIEDFNNFVSVSTYEGDTDKNVLRSIENERLVIKIISENRSFSISLQEMIQDIRVNKKNKHIYLENQFFQGDDYLFLILHVVGAYYEKSDGVSFRIFDGYLFYK